MSEIPVFLSFVVREDNDELHQHFLNLEQVQYVRVVSSIGGVEVTMQNGKRILLEGEPAKLAMRYFERMSLGYTYKLPVDAPSFRDL